MEEAHIIRISLSLALIIGLILLSGWITKRSGLLRNKGSHRINVLSSQRVGSRANLLLVQVGTQQLLLGVTPQHIQTLHQFESNADNPGEIAINTKDVNNPDLANHQTVTPNHTSAVRNNFNFKSVLRRRQQIQHIEQKQP